MALLLDDEDDDFLLLVLDDGDDDMDFVAVDVGVLGFICNRNMWNLLSRKKPLWMFKVPYDGIPQRTNTTDKSSPSNRFDTVQAQMFCEYCV